MHIGKPNLSRERRAARAFYAGALLALAILTRLGIIPTPTAEALPGDAVVESCEYNGSGCEFAMVEDMLFVGNPNIINK